MGRWIGVGAALLLAAGHAANLLGGAYAGHAERHLHRPGDPSVGAAARLASRITPWSERRQALSGWVSIETQRMAEADVSYRSALRWAPADPLLWAEYAQALSRQNRFDEAALLATRRAQSLAPNSPAVQGMIAALGLSFWPRGSQELRHAWQIAMRYELDHNRNSFLNQVLVRGQTRVFCTGPGPGLGETRWCEIIWQKLEDCRRRQNTPDALALCIAAL